MALSIFFKMNIYIIKKHICDNFIICIVLCESINMESLQKLLLNKIHVIKKYTNKPSGSPEGLFIITSVLQGLRFHSVQGNGNQINRLHKFGCHFIDNRKPLQFFENLCQLLYKRADFLLRQSPPQAIRMTSP